MTGTTTPTTDPADTLEHLDPNAINIENVRDDAVLDTLFLASVREYGVLQPITAIRTADGSRSATANGAPWPPAKPAWPPSRSTSSPTPQASQPTAERITQQIATNDHRSARTDAARQGCPPATGRYQSRQGRQESGPRP